MPLLSSEHADVVRTEGGSEVAQGVNPSALPMRAQFGCWWGERRFPGADL